MICSRSPRRHPTSVPQGPSPAWSAATWRGARQALAILSLLGAGPGCDSLDSAARHTGGAFPKEGEAGRRPVLAQLGPVADLDFDRLALRFNHTPDQVMVARTSEQPWLAGIIGSGALGLVGDALAPAQLPPWTPELNLGAFTIDGDRITVLAGGRRTVYTLGTDTEPGAFVEETVFPAADPGEVAVLTSAGVLGTSGFFGYDGTYRLAPQCEGHLIPRTGDAIVCWQRPTTEARVMRFLRFDAASTEPQELGAIGLYLNDWGVGAFDPTIHFLSEDGVIVNLKQEIPGDRAVALSFVTGQQVALGKQVQGGAIEVGGRWAWFVDDEQIMRLDLESGASTRTPYSTRSGTIAHGACLLAGADYDHEANTLAVSVQAHRLDDGTLLTTFAHDLGDCGDAWGKDHCGPVWSTTSQVLSFADGTCVVRWFRHDYDELSTVQHWPPVFEDGVFVEAGDEIVTAFPCAAASQPKLAAKLVNATIHTTLATPVLSVRFAETRDKYQVGTLYSGWHLDGTEIKPLFKRVRNWYGRGR